MKIYLLFLFNFYECSKAWDLASLNLNNNYYVNSVALHRTRAFLALPRSACLNNESDPTLIEAYWNGDGFNHFSNSRPKIIGSQEWNDCESIQDAISLEMEPVKPKLWILDKGNNQCAPKILSYSLIFNAIAESKEFTNIEGENLNTLVIDPFLEDALDHRAYIGHIEDNALLVFSLRKLIWWKIYLSQPSIFSSPIRADFLAISKGTEELFITGKYGFNLFSLNLEPIRQMEEPARDEKISTAYEVTHLGKKLGPSTGIESDRDSGLVYFMTRDYVILRWDTRFPLKAEYHSVLSQSYEQFPYISGFFSDSQDAIWAIINPASPNTCFITEPVELTARVVRILAYNKYTKKMDHQNLNIVSGENVEVEQGLNSESEAESSINSETETEVEAEIKELKEDYEDLLSQLLPGSEQSLKSSLEDSDTQLKKTLAAEIEDNDEVEVEGGQNDEFDLNSNQELEIKPYSIEKIAGYVEDKGQTSPYKTSISEPERNSHSKDNTDIEYEKTYEEEGKEEEEEVAEKIEGEQIPTKNEDNERVTAPEVEDVDEFAFESNQTSKTKPYSVDEAEEKASIYRTSKPEPEADKEETDPEYTYEEQEEEENNEEEQLNKSNNEDEEEVGDISGLEVEGLDEFKFRSKEVSEENPSGLEVEGLDEFKFRSKEVLETNPNLDQEIKVKKKVENVSSLKISKPVTENESEINVGTQIENYKNIYEDVDDEEEEDVDEEEEEDVDEEGEEEKDEEQQEAEEEEAEGDNQEYIKGEDNERVGQVTRPEEGKKNQFNFKSKPVLEIDPDGETKVGQVQKEGQASLLKIWKPTTGANSEIKIETDVKNENIYEEQEQSEEYLKEKNHNYEKEENVDEEDDEDDEKERENKEEGIKPVQEIFPPKEIKEFDFKSKPVLHGEREVEKFSKETEFFNHKIVDTESEINGETAIDKENVYEDKDAKEMEVNKYFNSEHVIDEIGKIGAKEEATFTKSIVPELEKELEKKTGVGVEDKYYDEEEEEGREIEDEDFDSEYEDY